MGWIDRLFGRQTTVAEVKEPQKTDIAVAAEKTVIDITNSYESKNITFHGCLKGYDYDRLLMNK